MPSLNKVLLIGHLGRDPEVRYLPSGDPVANFSVATSEQWKDKSGNKQERTEWHNIAVFGKLADIAKQILHKGSAVYVEGRIQTREWEAQDGSKRKSTEIHAHNFQALGGKPQGEGRPQQESKPNTVNNYSGGTVITDDDIPF